MKMFQIREDDLASLEREAAALCDEMMPHVTEPRQRRRVGILKEILSNVRWNYGPIQECHVIPADGDTPNGD